VIRQIGVGDSKYVAISYPHPHHVRCASWALTKCHALGDG